LRQLKPAAQNAKDVLPNSYESIIDRHGSNRFAKKLLAVGATLGLRW
jgi:hypothetical protein